MARKKSANENFQVSSEIVSIAERDNYAAAIFPCFAATSCNLPDDTSYDQWCRAAAMTKTAIEAGPWWVGDQLLFAEKRGKEWEEHAIQFMGDLGYDDKTLMNYLGVCKNIPPQYRRKELTFSHHDAVRGMRGKHLADILERAVQGTNGKRWTEKELRGYRREIEAEHAQNGNGAEPEAAEPKQEAAPEVAPGAGNGHQPEPQVKPAESERMVPRRDDDDDAENRQREPQVAKAAFPIDDEGWQEFESRCSKVRTEIAVLDGWLKEPERRQVPEVYQALVNTRDVIISAMDQAEEMGCEPR